MYPQHMFLWTNKKYIYLDTPLNKSNEYSSEYLNYLGPVVQGVVSLTSLLRVISLTILADSIYNILIFFAKKM